MKKYFPNTTYEKPTGFSLLRKAKPLEDVNTFAEYSKKYKTPNIDKLPSENIYKDIKQPYAYFYDDGRKRVVKKSVMLYNRITAEKKSAKLLR